MAPAARGNVARIPQPDGAGAVKFGCSAARLDPKTVSWGWPGGPQSGHEKGSVLIRFRGGISGAVGAVWDARRQPKKHVDSAT